MKPLVDMVRHKEPSEDAKAFALRSLTKLLRSKPAAKETLFNANGGISTLVGMSLHGADWNSHEMEQEIAEFDDAVRALRPGVAILAFGAMQLLADALLLCRQSEAESAVDEMPLSFVQARVAALQALMAAAGSPEDVLRISGHSCLEAVKKCMKSASEQVWVHLRFDP